MARKRQLELPPIEFEGAGGTPEEQEACVRLVEETEGFPLLTLMCVDLILRRVDLAVFEFSAQAVAFRYQIDGLWLPMPGMDRATGDQLLASLKQLAGLNWQDRRNRQEGRFRALYEKKRYEFRVVSQGVKTGERVGVYVGRKRDPVDTLTEQGMREQMKSRVAEILNGSGGLAVCSAVEGEGFTTCWRGFLAGGDRFMRDYYTLEAVGREEPEVINIGRVTWDPARGENMFSPIPALLLKEPNVLAFPELPGGAELNQMMELARQKDLMVLTRIAARSAADAIVRLLELRPDRAMLADSLRLVVNMRLVRKLCTACRQPFPPSPQLVQKLGFPAGRIRQLFRPLLWRSDMADDKGNPVPPCTTCFGTGYVGRIGVFETYEIGPALRSLIAAGETRAERLTAAAMDAGQVAQTEELALLVAKGVTSLEEMQRTLAPPKAG